MIRTSKNLFAHQYEMWADCQEWVQVIILDMIRGTIWAKMKKEPRVLQDHRKWYTDNWAAVAAELQSQVSSQTTRRLAHPSQTPGDWVVVAAELQSQPSS